MSTLNVSNISDGTDTVETGYVVNGSAKAWVSVLGDGTLVDGFNVSSVTDLGTSSNQINLANSFENSNYAILSTGTTNAAAVIAMFQTVIVSSFKINTRNADKNAVDAAARSACFGDLA
jgi:hypothetical protein